MSTIAREVKAAVPGAVPAPLNCTILATDIVGFGDPRRTDHHRLQLRMALISVLTGAFADAGLPWRRCRHQDRGDGLLSVAPPTISTTPFVDPLLARLAQGLRRYNEGADEPVRMRLRCALHVGPVLVDGAGYPSASIIHTARMLDATPLRRALAGSGADLAVMVSAYVHEAVVRHLGAPARRAAFRPTRYRAKGTPITSWLHVAAGAEEPDQVAVSMYDSS